LVSTESVKDKNPYLKRLSWLSSQRKHYRSVLSRRAHCAFVSL